MNDTTALAMIGSAITDFGTAVLTIVTATLVVGLGYLVFRFGWKKTKTSLGVNEGKDNFIYHSASDLEFKRNYGRR